jgi:hypothetical protein
VPIIGQQAILLVNGAAPCEGWPDGDAVADGVSETLADGVSGTLVDGVSETFAAVEVDKKGVVKVDSTDDDVAV